VRCSVPQVAALDPFDREAAQAEVVAVEAAAVVAAASQLGVPQSKDWVAAGRAVSLSVSRPPNLHRIAQCPAHSDD